MVVDGISQGRGGIIICNQNLLDRMSYRRHPRENGREVVINAIRVDNGNHFSGIHKACGYNGRITQLAVSVITISSSPRLGLHHFAPTDALKAQM